MDDTTFVMRASVKVNGVWQVKWIRMDTLGNELYSKSIADNVYIGASTGVVVALDKKIVGLSKHINVNYLFKLNAQFEYDPVYTYQYVYEQSIQQSDHVYEISTINWPRGIYCFRLVFRGATNIMALVVVE